MRLFLCEKPSQGKDIGRILGATQRGEGYLNGSGVTVTWDPDTETILDLAEANGLTPDFSCRSGVCHTCMCTLIEGEIEYVNDDALLPDEEGQILICSSKPKTDITVDV